MTTKVKETELLDILNELFGRFDDASDVGTQIITKIYNYNQFLYVLGIKSSSYKIFRRLLLLCSWYTSKSSTKSCRSVCRSWSSNDINNCRDKVKTSYFQINLILKVYSI